VVLCVDADVTEPRASAAVAASYIRDRHTKERIMTFATTTLAALSIAAVSAVAFSIEPGPVGRSTETTTVTTKSDEIVVAGGRRRKCQEDLGYGRTGSFGCGG